MKKILMYHHGTSYNHGCEALVRTISASLDEALGEKCEYIVSTADPKKDERFFGTGDPFRKFVLDENTGGISRQKQQLLLGAFSRIFHCIPFFNTIYKPTVNAAKDADMIISVGGDNYSYGPAAKRTVIDNKLRRLCPVSVLWGCSINPDMLTGRKYRFKAKGLRRFTLITARETLTYEALLSLGLDNVKLYPDPAFALPVVQNPAPMFNNGKDVVGINVSPLLTVYENADNIAIRCFENLCRHIFETTDFNIALISHVVFDAPNGDTCVAEKLAERLGEYSDRMRIIDEGNAMELKGHISKCRFFVAARTHASVAAYSTCVPTLVVGYSVKSKGIAKDLFGTWEGYVVPIDNMKDEGSLSREFDKLMENEAEIRAHLKEIMPEYISRAKSAGQEIASLIKTHEDA